MFGLLKITHPFTSITTSKYYHLEHLKAEANNIPLQPLQIKIPPKKPTQLVL